MATYTYGQWLATDDQGNPVKNAVGNLYDPNDTAYATPLTVFDLTGNPITSVSTDAKSYMGQQFTSDVAPLIWMANGTTPIKMWSPEMFSTYAQTAADDASASAAAAQAAQAAAEAASTGGVTVTDNGDYYTMTIPGA